MKARDRICTRFVSSIRATTCGALAIELRRPCAPPLCRCVDGKPAECTCINSITFRVPPMHAFTSMCMSVAGRLNTSASFILPWSSRACLRIIFRIPTALIPRERLGSASNDDVASSTTKGSSSTAVNTSDGSPQGLAPLAACSASNSDPSTPSAQSSARRSPDESLKSHATPLELSSLSSTKASSSSSPRGFETNVRNAMCRS
mmetsp:Transcript_40126/g.110467  ORF Transcript_40126/g.110467 Transcript_40126/m.110467 type:complete len:204 (+) Transcript_40126:4883-5494(+)